VNKLTIYTVSK